MNNILITGSKGQLGSELQKISHSYDFQCFFTDVEELDITNYQAIEKFIQENQINFIINCAAYTNVDKAEDDETTANRINHLAVGNLATAAQRFDCFLVHISTDYVFDGTHHTPYQENEPTSPLGVYGKTKLDGEKAVLHSHCKHLIIRTSWLYSSFGNNFVKTMKRLTAEKDSLQVVFDQVGTPTYAADLAKAIFTIIQNPELNEHQGIYHFSNEGVCSWYDFAVEIRNVFGNDCKIDPCHSDEFPSKVKRPHFSVLDKSKIKKAFNLEIPYWKDSLIRCAELLKENQNLDK